MFRATIDKMRQFMGFAALLALAVLPFAGSMGNWVQHGHSVSTGDSILVSQPLTTASVRTTHWPPSSEELLRAFEKVRGARMEVLRCAALQNGVELEVLARRYQNAIQEWKDTIRNVQARMYPEEAQDVWYDFSGVVHSDVNSRALYAWEVEQICLGIR